jgi:very-short-patch-repair endonuclease
MLSAYEIKQAKRRMKRKPTTPETKFAGVLEANDITYKPQVIIGFFIADFLIPSRALVVEIDGPSHDAAYDARRDSLMREWGFSVLRVPNAGAATFDVSALGAFPIQPESQWRSGVARANAARGKHMRSKEAA